MIRIFLDASALFSAALSPTSGSRALIWHGYEGDVELIVSEFILEEARRNLLAKVPYALPVFEAFVATAPFTIVDATRAQVVSMARHCVLQDAPVVAAAKRARAAYIVSLSTSWTRHVASDSSAPGAATSDPECVAFPLPPQ